MEPSNQTPQNLEDSSILDYIPELTDDRKKVLLGGTAIALVGIAGYLGYKSYKNSKQTRKDSLSSSDLSLSDSQQNKNTMKKQQQEERKSKSKQGGRYKSKKVLYFDSNDEMILDSELSSGDASEIDTVHSLRRGTSNLETLKNLEEEEMKLSQLNSGRNLQKKHSRIIAQNDQSIIESGDRRHLRHNYSKVIMKKSEEEKNLHFEQMTRNKKLELQKFIENVQKQQMSFRKARTGKYFREDSSNYQNFETPKDQLKRTMKEALSSTSAQTGDFPKKQLEIEELRLRREYEKAKQQAKVKREMMALTKEDLQCKERFFFFDLYTMYAKNSLEQTEAKNKKQQAGRLRPASQY